jgi:hypothetical protein
VLALAVVYLDLRVTCVQFPVSMFIVVVQVVATCSGLVCAVSAGVDVGARSDLRLRVTVRDHSVVPGCDCAPLCGGVAPRGFVPDCQMLAVESVAGDNPRSLLPLFTHLIPSLPANCFRHISTPTSQVAYMA